MQVSRPRWDFRNWRFLVRLALAYLIVPLTAPTLFVLCAAGGGQRMDLLDRAGILLLYAAFCFAAMVALGTPLIVLYSRLQWTGFFHFMAGGAICAAVTYTIVARGHAEPDQLVIFTLFGVVEGLAFRLILFGSQWACAPAPSGETNS